MIVWIIAGGLSWGTLFGLAWKAIMHPETVDTIGFVLLATLCILVGAFSGFAETSARQEIAKLRHNVSWPIIRRILKDIDRDNGAPTATDS